MGSPLYLADFSLVQPRNRSLPSYCCRSPEILNRTCIHVCLCMRAHACVCVSKGLILYVLMIRIVVLRAVLPKLIVKFQVTMYLVT